MVGSYDDRNLALTWAQARPEAALRHRPHVAPVDPLEVEMAGIKADRKSLDRRIVGAVKVLAARREWTAVIRLLVLAGSYQQADIAKATGVMRSTVTRWFNGETTPQAEQVEIYLAGLIRLLEAERDMNIFARTEDLIID